MAAAAAAADSLRVLVIGPVFAGKSTLLSAIGRPDDGEARRHVPRTVGCATAASIHTCGDGVRYHVEWLEVGAASQFAAARSVFYRDFDGILAVFDAASDRSFNSVLELLAEVAESLGDRAEASAAAASARQGTSPTLPPSSYSEEDGGSQGGSRRRMVGGVGGGGGGSGPGRPASSSSVVGGAAVGTKGGGASPIPVHSREQVVAAALRSVPILLLANKYDTIEAEQAANAAGAAGHAGDGLTHHHWRHAISAGVSRTKLGVSVRGGDARSVTVCGATCRRPQRVHRVIVEARVAIAVRGAVGSIRITTFGAGGGCVVTVFPVCCPCLLAFPSQSALTDDIPLDAIESFLDDIIAAKFSDDGDDDGR